MKNNTRNRVSQVVLLIGQISNSKVGYVQYDIKIAVRFGVGYLEKKKRGIPVKEYPFSLAINDELFRLLS